MTKAEIVEHIYERVGFSKKESAELVEKVFEIIKETLAEGEKVKISARRVLTFKPSLVLKNTLNDGDAPAKGIGADSGV